LSSTTEQAERGQILVLFAGALLAIVLVAALAFDTGSMLLERRDQQNAADAAAIAGARWLPGDPAAARAAARALATANGFTDGVDSESVDVQIPPASGTYAGRAGHIQVQIGSNRPSIFAGVMSVAGWGVSVSAVATNQDDTAGPFAMLALDPSGCEALLVSGNGTVNSNGNLQVNSTCVNDALKRTGGGVITVNAPDAACNVVGGVQSSGGGALNCTVVSPAAAIPDPLGGLDEPAVPSLADPVTYISGTPTDVPIGCPGTIPETDAATDLNPATCQFPSSYAGSVWRLHPGYYPGGIRLQGGTFYFEPGIYYLGGGGLTITGTGAAALSVNPGGTTLGGGVLFFNTEAYEFHDECAAGTGAADECIGPIVLNGAQASIDFESLDIGSAFDGLVIFQDRDFNMTGDDVTVNGSSSTTTVRGTIYVPSGDVKINGSGGNVTTDQVIAFRFQINGAPGSVINVLYDTDFTFNLSAAGLVE
jgi:hypothetical protein